MVDPSTPHRLHELLMDLVRVAGLLHPDQTVPGHPLSLSQAFALHELDTDEPLSQRDVAQRLRLEKSTVSRLVADLEGRGLVTRRRDPDNRRLYRLQITAEGRKAHARMGSVFHDQYVRMTAALTGPEQAALLEGLPALIRVLRQAHARDVPTTTDEIEMIKAPSATRLQAGSRRGARPSIDVSSGRVASAVASDRRGVRGDHGQFA